jgi:c(7)-type cytochrome triheme protein
MPRISLPRITFWRVVFVVILLAGAYATWIRFTRGLIVTNLTDRSPWGLWIGFSVLCVIALAAGGFTISAVVHVFNLEDFKPVVRSTILTAFLGYSLYVVGLLVELGRPYNVWHPIVMWNPHSVMFEIGMCAMFYTAVLMFEFSPMLFERLKWQKALKIIKGITTPLVFLGVLLSTMHQSSLGTLFLIVPGKLHPLWYTPRLPVLFFVSAVALGLAMTIFESYLSMRAFRRGLHFDILTRLGKAVSIVLILYFILRFGDLYFRGVLGRAFEPSYEGRIFLAEIVLGIVAPVTMLLIPSIRKNQLGLFIAALMVVLGFALNRMNVGITGLDRSSGVNYFPSFVELAITAAIIASGFLLFGLAVKYLEVFPREEMNRVAGGKLSPLPALVALRQPVWSATSLTLVVGTIFAAATLALSYDGIRRRVPNVPTADGGAVDIRDALTHLQPPTDIRITMGKTSPGQVIFSHTKHLNANNPNCTQCHPALFRMLRTTADITPDRKMRQCGTCHDAVQAVGILQKDRCDSCHKKT